MNKIECTRRSGKKEILDLTLFNCFFYVKIKVNSFRLKKRVDYINEKDESIGEYRMFDVKKEQERDELHRAIWSIADDLRGSYRCHKRMC